MDWTERAWLAETLVLTIVFERLAKVRTGVSDQLHGQADQHQEGFLCGALPDDSLCGTWCLSSRVCI